MIINYDPNAFNPTFLNENIESSGHILSDMLGNVVNRFHEFDLPNDVIHDAIHRACDFMGIHDLPFFHNKEVGIYTNNPTTFSDDIIEINRDQLFNLDVHNSNDLSLIITHEITHGLLQFITSQGGLSPWQEELICDSFMGARAVVENLSTSRIEAGLEPTEASDTHPYGELRLKYIEIGKEIAEDLISRDLPVTTDNILSRLDDYLTQDTEHIHKCEQIERAKNESTFKGYNAKYSETEISNLRDKLSSAKYNRDCIQNELSNWKSKESILRDNKDRVSDYNYAVSKVNELQRKLSDANFEVKEAQVRLNNAT